MCGSIVTLGASDGCTSSCQGGGNVGSCGGTNAVTMYAIHKAEDSMYSVLYNLPYNIWYSYYTVFYILFLLRLYL